MSDNQATGMPPGRTLLLWLAALAVTWVSGIEPTWRKVQDVTARFEEVNLQRHEADRKAIAHQQVFDGERAEQVELRDFKAAYPPGEAREKKRAKLFATLVAAQAEVSQNNGAALRDPALDTDQAKPCASAMLAVTGPSPRGNNKAEKEYASAIDLLRNFCEAERRLDLSSSDQQKARLDDQRKDEERHQKELAAARTHADSVRDKSNVDFELLGVKFTAEPLLASLLWSCFAFAWLVAARQEAVQAEGPTSVANGNEPGRHASDLRLLALLTLWAWAMQVRVAWLGLGITAQTGEMMWKALVAIAVCMLFLGSAALVVMILAHRPLAARPPAHARSSRLLITAATLVFLGVFAAAWWMPSHALRFSHGVMPALPLLGALPLLLLALLWWYARWREVARPASPGRRLFMIGSAGAVAATLAGAVWWQAHTLARPVINYKVAVRHPRKRRAPNTPIKLATGFYRNINIDGATIVHYISDGLIAARERLPRTMKPIPRPVYGWQGASRRYDAPEVRREDQDEDDSGEIPELPAELRPWNLESYRVALATASWAFEHAALLILSKHAAGRKNVKRACELLLNGIHHDVQYKKRHANARKRSAPSYRLYDLAAGLAVRYNQPQVLEELKHRIKQDGYVLLFESRIKKWDDVNSAWYRRWRERQVPMRWQSSQRVSVF
jgi:hypothetical protein